MPIPNAYLLRLLAEGNNRGRVRARPGRINAERYPDVSVPDAGRLTRVEIAVTSVGAGGTVHQAIVETAGRVDADW